MKAVDLVNISQNVSLKTGILRTMEFGKCSPFSAVSSLAIYPMGVQNHLSILKVLIGPGVKSLFNFV